MKKLFIINCISIIILLFCISSYADRVIIPRGINHSVYNNLLKKYVDDLGLVNYTKWKSSHKDMKLLQEYLSQYSILPKLEAVGNERYASLINAYNAFTLHWILINYPTDSIKSHNSSWTKKRHKIGGELCSLDQIEHKNLRPEIGWKAHAVLVCAARSCPPLQPFAYDSKILNEQIKLTFQLWLSRLDLNAYYIKDNNVKISKIFEWYGGDFNYESGIRYLLLKYAPDRYHDFLKRNKYEIIFRKYRWELNDQRDR